MYPQGTYDGKKIPGIGEWIMLRGRIPVAEYRGYAKEFNPVKYDPVAWAKLAKQAGMKIYRDHVQAPRRICSVPSDVTDWDIADASPLQ